MERDEEEESKEEEEEEKEENLRMRQDIERKAEEDRLMAEKLSSTKSMSTR